MEHEITDTTTKRIIATFYPRWSENMVKAVIESMNYKRTPYEIAKEYNIEAAALYRGVARIESYFVKCLYIINGQNA